ncbi:hypothetical protein [Amycolatopsis australiensis]|uniref:hypothetical protein n=1 Tax=Amycolatopsis australiensis TaxID=546364 RepID=UPI001FE44ED2|nr:hypothetical protein [Amycolatopsis australiensis]
MVPAAGTYGSEAGASGGAGFQYDEATLRELMHEWNDLANEFKLDQQHAIVLARTKGPGIEYASSGNAEKINQSGNALLETLIEREEYCRKMAAKFKAALGRYAQAEDDHTTEIRHTGGSL